MIPEQKNKLKKPIKPSRLDRDLAQVASKMMSFLPSDSIDYGSHQPSDLVDPLASTQHEISSSTVEFDQPNYEKMALPADVNAILGRLNLAGEGFIVGGAVRDTLLGKQPKDYDFTTNLNYETVAELFASCPHKEVGKAFGIITINYNGEDYEIAQYRQDLNAKNRAETEVGFVEHVEDDLSRRDFTINALAYNPQRGIVDLFNGQDDIKNRTIRFIGDPSQRVKEDGLRIMRAFRFASTKGFHLAPETAQAILEYRTELDTISPDRINLELTKILTGDNVKNTLIAMQETHVLDQIIPEFKETYGYQQDNPHHQEPDLFSHIIDVVDGVNADPILRYAALFHDLAKPKTRTTDERGIGHYYGHEEAGALLAKDILERLRLPKEIIEKSTELIANHMAFHGDPSTKTMAKYIRQLGVEQSARLVELTIADNGAKGSIKTETDLLAEQNLKQKYAEALKLAQPGLTVNTLALNGHVLKELGFSGQAIGAMKKQLLTLILDGKLENTQDSLLEFVKQTLEKS